MLVTNALRANILLMLNGETLVQICEFLCIWNMAEASHWQGEPIQLSDHIPGILTCTINEKYLEQVRLKYKQFLATE